MKILEQRAAWAFLGIPIGTADQAALRRAFKRKALELHPDKGGDTARFQLLQEMKDLLILPLPKAENRSPEENAGCDAGESEGPNADDDFFGGDEEEDRAFREMFQGEEREAWARSDERDEEAELCPVGEAFDRTKQEATRRKLRQSVLEIWEKCGRLAAELHLEPAAGRAAEVLRPLRGLLGGLAHAAGGLALGDSKGARALLQQFLDEGSEALCAAGAVDPAAAASAVTAQLSLPLLAAAPSLELQELCHSLVEAIHRLPRTFEDFVQPALEVLRPSRPAPTEEATTLVPDQVPEWQVAAEVVERQLPRLQASWPEPEAEKEPAEGGHQEEPEAEAEEEHLRCASWDTRWYNHCAGERRDDGTAVYCVPCAAWINLRMPFDHLEYELHCKGPSHTARVQNFMQRLWGTLCGEDCEP